MELFRKYIKDIVYGANDGIITTFAVISGAVGASLSTDVILILGFANLVADGFSMAASNYLGSRSEKEVVENRGRVYEKSIKAPPAFTFISFILAGALPLLPYVILDNSNFGMAILFTVIALFAVGSLRSAVVKGHWLIRGVEMLTVGGTAAVIAYVIGYIIRQIISG